MGVSWRWYSGDKYQKWSKGDPTKIRMANLRPILDGHPGWVMVTMVVLAITGTLEISMDWWSLTMTTKQPDDHQTTRWNKKPGDSQNCQRVFTSEFEQWLWVKTYFMLEGSIGSLGSSWKRLSTALKPFVFWKRIHPWKVTLEPKKQPSWKLTNHLPSTSMTLGSMFIFQGVLETALILHSSWPTSSPAPEKVWKVWEQTNKPLNTSMWIQKKQCWFTCCFFKNQNHVLFGRPNANGFNHLFPVWTKTSLEKLRDENATMGIVAI